MSIIETGGTIIDLGRLIPRHARYRRGHAAVVFGDRRLSYSAFNDQVNRLANTPAELGVSKCDRVVAILPNRMKLLELYWACGKLGAISVPLSPPLQQAGIRSLLQDAGPRVVIAHQGLAASLETIRTALTEVPDWHQHSPGDGEDQGQFRSYHRLLDEASAFWRSSREPELIPRRSAARR